MRKSIVWLSVIAAIAAICSSCLGLFYTTSGVQRTVQNIYGKAVVLFGDGIYANDSLMKVGATKGTDWVVLAVSILILCAVFFYRDKKSTPFLFGGLLAILLYASTCQIMGVSFNRLFLLYVVQFGCALFAFVLSIADLLRNDALSSLYLRRLTGTGVFLLVAGCSVLVWIPSILPTMLTGEPMAIIDTYTTEPTFALDLAIILPTAIWCGILMLKRKVPGYQIAPVLLTLLTGVGACVIMQTVVQVSLGIILEPGQLVGLVGSFVILGTAALMLNIRLLKHAR